MINISVILLAAVFFNGNTIKGKVSKFMMGIFRSGSAKPAFG